ncbi:hypothetical protein AB0J43_60200, partial [Nonomuraea fuscirosea]
PAPDGPGADGPAEGRVSRRQAGRIASRDLVATLVTQHARITSAAKSRAVRIDDAYSHIINPGGRTWGHLS